MKQVIIIPARYGSTRFPGKPLILIDGKPMIQHVYERALSSKTEEIWVATDDERILQEVLRFGGKALMTAKTHICGTDRIAEATELLGLSPEDIVVNLQGDQPFFPSEYFQLLTEPLLSGKAKMATLATPIKTEEDLYNPNKVKVVLDCQGYALYFSRSLIPYFRTPGDPPLYLKHIGVYAYTKEFLDLFVKLPPGTLELTEKLEQLRALEHGYKIAVNIVPEDVPEVDTPEDLEKLTKLRGM